MAKPAQHQVPQLHSDTAANDSDKTFTVPTGKIWQVLSIRVELTSDATAGNRQLEVQTQSPAGDVTSAIQTGATQAASLTYNYELSPTVSDLTSLRDSVNLTTPIPIWILPSGSIIRVYDNNAVAAAADDMVVHLSVLETDM